MSIYRAFKLWSKPSSTPSSISLELDNPGKPEEKFNAESCDDPISNVVQLAPGTPLDVPAGLNAQASVRSPEAMQTRSLMDAAELQIFFSDTYFGLGRHNGAQYKTQEALKLGSQTIVSKFQNTLELLIAQRQTRVDALRSMVFQTQGVCATITGQLNLACQQLERDMASLQSQSALAADGKGWVLKALNEYQIGFGKGLREAIEMELLV